MKLPFFNRRNHRATPTPEELAEQKLERRNRRMVRLDAVMAVLIDSITSLLNNRPAQAAASIAYYFLFSIFPLTIFVVISLSYIADVEMIQSQIVNFLQGTLPGSELLVVENLQNLLSYRRTTSIFATLSLLWSGSGMFNGIISNIQKAWPESRERGYFINRAFAITLIILLLVLVVFLVTVTIVFSLDEAAAVFNLPVGPRLTSLIHLFSSFVLPMLTLYSLGYLLYHSIPTAEVSKKAARISSLLFAVAWRAFTELFSMYILSPMNRYDLVYGSLAVVIVLLLYIYFSSFIILYPAHLAAAITHYYQRRARLPKTRKPAVAARKASKIQSNVSKTLGAAEGVPILSDPIVLAPTEEKKKTDPRKAVWDFIKGLFRWK